MASLLQEEGLQHTNKRSVSPFDRRWILSYVCFLGFVFLYITRVNISVAIICMVRSAVSNTSLTNTSSVNASTDDADILDEACGSLEAAASGNLRGEFDWDKSTRSRILAMYFYGYIFTQIPGGWLAGRYGAKRVWGSAMFVNGLGTILTPVSARFHLYLLYAVRFLMGFAAGVSFPAIQSLWGRWAPPLERSRLISLTLAGPHVGTIIAFSSSGVLCASGFDSGWGSIFYIFGCSILIGQISANRFCIIPLYGLLMYRRKKVSTTCTTCQAAAACNNGAISSIPYVCHSVIAVAAGQLADIVRTKTQIGTTKVRKIWQCTCFLSVAVFLVATGFITCENRMVAVALLCIAVGCTGINKGAYSVNHVDISPRHCGVLFGITNTMATVPGMIAPLVAGVLTPNKTPEEWRSVLYICAGLLVFGAIVYTLLASGETQSWNDYGVVTSEVQNIKSDEYVAIQSLNTDQSTETATEKN